MDKTLVIYFSKYGTTKRYAEWIAEELKGNIFEIKNGKNIDFNEYNIIVLGSGLYAGNIKGINLLENSFNKIKDKKIVLFTCGLEDYNKIENINNVNKRLFKVIPKELLDRIKIFYLQGGINNKQLNLKHKIMMAMLKYMTMKKGIDKMNEEDKEFLETYGQKIDFTDSKNIKEIIGYCKNNRRRGNYA